MQMRRRMLAMAGAVALAAGTGLVVLGGAPAGAAVSPTTTADDGSAGSLREILENLGGLETVVLQAGATYLLTNDAAGEIDINDAAIIEGNGATIQQTDNDDNVLETGDTLTLRNVTITGGRANFGDGGGVETNDGDDTLLLEDATIIDNATFDDDGGGIDSAGPLIVVRSTIAGNCAEDDGGAIRAGDTLTLVNSTVTGNVGDADGAIDMDNDATLSMVYSDVVSNTHTDDIDCGSVVTGTADAAAEADDPEEAAEETAEQQAEEVEPLETDEPSNVDFDGGQFLAFGSVVALPLGSDPVPFNCEDANTTSSGYNFSDDDTCGFTNVAAGDRENAGDPGLGALAGNGGPTQTLLPATTSPLVNFIPIAACGGGDALVGALPPVTTDQRGITRPQATGCEIGSVELEVVAVVAEPTFTG